MKKKAIDSPSDYMEMFARLAEARASMQNQRDTSATPKHDVPGKQINAERLHDFPDCCGCRELTRLATPGV